MAKINKIKKHSRTYYQDVPEQHSVANEPAIAIETPAWLNWHENVLSWFENIQWFKNKPQSDLDWAQLVGSGFPYNTIETAVKDGIISRDEVYDLVIRQRTLSHRKEKNELLTADESDKLLRLLRIKAIAFDFFGSAEKANLWLYKPNRGLGGELPIRLIATETGARIVEDQIERLSWGVYA